jgi:transposase-like protein
MSRRWTPELRRQFRTAWNEGVFVSEICERFQTSKGQVHRLRKQMGLALRKPGCGGGRPKKEQPHTVVTLPANMTSPLPESSIPWPDKARLMAGR